MSYSYLLKPTLEKPEEYKQSLNFHKMTIAPEKKVRVWTEGKSKRRTPDVIIKAGNRPVSLVPRNPSLKPGYQGTHLPGVNQKQRATLQYFVRGPAQSSTVASTFAVPFQAQLNGVYDPSYTYAAGQPAAFAKYMTWYSKCCVTAAKLKITVAGYPAQYTPMTIGLTCLTNNTNPANVTEAITGGPRTYAVLGEDGKPVTLTQKIDIFKFLGVPNLLDNVDYSCTSSANPNQIVVSQFWVDNATGVTGYYSWWAEIVFEVVFYDPVLIT